MPGTPLDYEELYTKFITEYKRGMVSGEEVGECIARLAHYYAFYNRNLADANRQLATIAMDNELKTDSTTGKPISSTKAATFTEASGQASLYNIAKVHVQNIECYINALKALQKGVLNEYANSSL